VPHLFGFGSRQHIIFVFTPHSLSVTDRRIHLDVLLGQMDVEITMRFILEQQAHISEGLARLAEQNTRSAGRNDHEMAELRAELDRAEQFFRSTE
jgi:hypothetical protein